jgi:mannose-6-phosphate isomerase-like protein (cupin superfamily)
MDINEYKQKARLLRDNETYRVFDLDALEDLNLSFTELKPGKLTTGHSHTGADEVYIFVSGKGEMEIDEKKEKVKKGYVFLIPEGSFHRVHNNGWRNLKFWSVFEKYEGRGLK